MLTVLQTALEVGLIYGLVALALFISFSILNIADLSTDGCFTLGCAVGAMLTIAGHPILALFAAMAANSARIGWPAMVSMAPTAQPSVKQPSVERSAIFRMEKLMNSASATRP